MLRLLKITVLFFVSFHTVIIPYNENHYFYNPKNKYKKQTALLTTNLDRTFKH